MPGAPGEIGPVALVGNAIGPQIAGAWDRLGLGTGLENPEDPRLPGISHFEEGGRFFALDANSDGAVDLRLFYEGWPPPSGAGDLVFG